ncbi:19973_t:CDS:2, partial [Cetraspora pellucida]
MLASIIGDWPENYKSCLTYSGTKCACPCYICLVEKDKLNVINLPVSQKIIRTKDQMQQVIALKQGKDYSLHEETNNLRLFEHMIKCTQDLLKAYEDNALVNKIDLRLRLIPHHPGLKVFNNELADLTLFTASEYKHMMKIMPFVLEGLLEKNQNKLLIQMFVNWNKMYNQSRQYKFTPSDLYQFESLIESYEYEQVYVPEILKGLHNLVFAMNDYFNLVPIVERQIEESELTFILYESFVLPNKERVRFTKNFHNEPIFSNVSIHMNPEEDEFETFDGFCFAKYECPYLQLTDIYNMILVESISNVVHI